MPNNLRIGVIGLVHDHVWKIFKEIRELVDVNITCVADVNDPLLDKVNNLGVRTYKSYDMLLDKEEIDAVIVCTENSRHAEVTAHASEKGLHVMTEKPMAATLKQAEKMLNASRKHGVKLMINYPTAWAATLREAHTLAVEGRIGKIHQVRFRAAHEGPKEIGCSSYFYKWLYDKELNGAGAFMDYCCYGANLCRWILGIPEKAVSLGGTYVRDYLTVDDNAILLMGYKKAMGIAEASWSQIGEGIPPRYTLIINGSRGVIAAGKDLKIYTAEKKVWETIQTSPLKKERRNALEHFVTCIREDKPFDDLVSAVHNRDTQAILEAGLISMEENRTVILSELMSRG